MDEWTELITTVARASSFFILSHYTTLAKAGMYVLALANKLERPNKEHKQARLERRLARRMAAEGL